MVRAGAGEATGSQGVGLWPFAFKEPTHICDAQYKYIPKMNEETMLNNLQVGSELMIK